MFNFLPTDEKLRSRNSAKRGSVEVVKWCFFFASFLTLITGAVVTVDVEGLLDDGAGGVNKEIGSSTWADKIGSIST